MVRRGLVFNKMYLTDIERIMYDELVIRNINFVPQKPFRVGFIADFFLPDLNIIVECDGEKWHKLGNKRDRFRDYLLSRCGCKVIRFWGEEIKSDVSSCVDKIFS